MGGILQPSTGTVELAGNDILLRHAICWIPQGVNSVPHRSAVHNVAIGALASGCGRRQAYASARRALSTLGLEAIATHQAARLSGGELQRVAVARAMVSTRSFLFADEPTGQLDADNSQAVREALRVAAEQGKAVVVVTHDLAGIDSQSRTVEL